MLCFDRYLAVIPINRNHSNDQLHSRPDDSRIGSSYVIDLFSDIKPSIDHVKDFVFLQGYYQPTLLVLHEPEQTWAG